MSYITANRRIGSEFFMLTISERNDAKPGQFCMLRLPGWAPLLARPLSVYDRDYFSLTFLYKVVGEGTSIIAKLRAGDEIVVSRVHGTHFPIAQGRIALVGGGSGIAPMHLASKMLHDSGGAKVDTFLGFTSEALLTDDFACTSDTLIVDVGGFITDRVDTSLYDVVMACGPEKMLIALHEKCMSSGTKLYVSLEKKMACGFGACLGCSRKMRSGMKRICKDGPVFESQEVFF